MIAELGGQEMVHYEIDFEFFKAHSKLPSSLAEGSGSSTAGIPSRGRARVASLGKANW